MNKKKARYNDGYVSIYRKKKEDLTRNKNIQSLSDLDFLLRLAYGETSRRQQDQEFAEQNSFSLSLKIRTQRPQVEKVIHSGCFAVIGKNLYAVEYIDRNDTEYYMYLEKIRELEG